MLRSTKPDAAGRGELILEPEGDDERTQLLMAFPIDKPADSITGYEWREGKLVCFHRKDPNIKLPPVLTKPTIEGYQPVPTREHLETVHINKLITMAAELEVTHKVGETKAALISKIVDAWTARNKKLDEEAAKKS